MRKPISPRRSQRSPRLSGEYSGSLHHRGTEITEFGVCFNQELFTKRTEPVLSDVEGRLSGESFGCVFYDWNDLNDWNDWNGLKGFALR